MTILALVLSLFVTAPMVDAAISDHVGKWNYTVEAPDMTYKGVLELTGSDGDYAGTMNAQGLTIELKDVEIEDDEISFNMNVQGFPCKVSGTFEGDELNGVVTVEGFEIPLAATRAE